MNNEHRVKLRLLLDRGDKIIPRWLSNSASSVLVTSSIVNQSLSRVGLVDLDTIVRSPTAINQSTVTSTPVRGVVSSQFRPHISCIGGGTREKGVRRWINPRKRNKRNIGLNTHKKDKFVNYSNLS